MLPIPPRWRVVAALFSVSCCAVTALAGFGVFLPVLATEFGWSRGAISVALTINLMLGGLAAFGVAQLADRQDPRRLLVLTVVVGAVGFVASSGVAALWHLYLTYGLLVGLGTSSLYVLTTATVSRWFHDKRGLALGCVLMGFNLGFVLGGPLAAFLIRHWGWRRAFVALGALVALVGLPASACVRFPSDAGEPRSATTPRPLSVASAAPAGTSVRQAVAESRLWRLVAAWCLLGGVFMMMAVHAVPFALDRGLPLAQASLALTAWGVGSTLGRLGAGLLTDRWGVGPVMTATVLVQALALAGLLTGPAGWELGMLLVLFGAGAGGADTAFVRMIPDVFGLGSLAGITSLLTMGWRIGAGLGPAAAGYAHDLTSSYAGSFGAGLVALAAGFMLFRRGVRGPRGRSAGGGPGRG